MSVDLSSDATPPSARCWPFIASTGKLVCLWGGRGDTEPESVFLFHRGTKTWARQRTRGPHPPDQLYNGCCCISGQHFYIFGGWDAREHYHGVLYELNTNSWTWSKLSDGGAAGGPGKKDGCRMMAYQDQLLIVGGIPRSELSYYKDGEVHCFNLTTGKRQWYCMSTVEPPYKGLEGVRYTEIFITLKPIGNYIM